MPEIKDLTMSADKWSRNAGAASTEYASNAAGKADKWGRQTQAASENYRQSLSVGNIAQRFARGVARAVQNGKYARRISAVGSSRYSEGVGAGKTDWQQGFEPYHGVLQTVSLPPRRPRGDVGNIERVKAVTTALNAKRIAMLGAG